MKRCYHENCHTLINTENDQHEKCDCPDECMSLLQAKYLREHSNFSPNIINGKPTINVPYASNSMTQIVHAGHPGSQSDKVIALHSLDIAKDLSFLQTVMYVFVFLLCNSFIKNTKCLFPFMTGKTC